MNRFRSLLILSCIAAIVLMSCPSALDACPTCKAAMKGGSHGGLAEGFYWSILFMMSMPFLILGSLSLMFYMSIKRAQRNGTSTAADVVGMSSTTVGAEIN